MLEFKSAAFDAADFFLQPPSIKFGLGSCLREAVAAMPGSPRRFASLIGEPSPHMA
ncbi:MULTISPECIES: hypothetical protein [Rhodanobacter]|uniref:Uncharacterized protein n=1 Tax=Rhodanobacter hydrolyticus TaxID=2250595 RepID=A0ABW8J404_9GAMM|nr:hypothetical protein [Rhodanobacter sp. 7MK24]MBD8879290.1 hypothetical protein [Rhodanobacter sp. 7MK24]